jgi:hypothetical protein
MFFGKNKNKAMIHTYKYILSFIIGFWYLAACGQPRVYYPHYRLTLQAEIDSLKALSSAAGEIVEDRLNGPFTCSEVYEPIFHIEREVFHRTSILRELDMDSLLGISISVRCFDSLVVSYTDYLCKQNETDIDTLLLLDIVRVYITFFATYSYPDKPIYRNLISGVRQYDLLTKLGFVNSIWGGAPMSKKYHMTVPNSGEDRNKLAHYLKHSKYCLRYAGD